jgi:non-heme Fe2+,alpha-ketoglutarate-dependent halogenase
METMSMDSAIASGVGTDGYYAPIRVLSENEAKYYRNTLEAYERAAGGPLAPRLRTKSHLLASSLDKLIRHPRILDAVEQVLGPDLLVWSSAFFIKEARDPAYVSWHQDSTYWGLSSPDVVTAWVALSPSTRESGCLRVVPGTHKTQVQHIDKYDPTNLLTRGQEIAVDVDESKVVDLPLAPGEMSIHHIRIFHGSEPNNADDRRLGLAIRYIPTHVYQTSGMQDSAMLVRGEDTFHHFVYERCPVGDFTAENLAYHEEIVNRQRALLMRQAERK